MRRVAKIPVEQKIIGLKAHAGKPKEFSTFRTRRIASHHLRAALCGMVGLGIALLIFQAVKEVAVWVSVMVFGALCLFISYHLIEAKIWGIGAAGEERVAEMLKNLPPEYTTINDVLLPSGVHIDHIVLGPNGIFVIETKNHRGLIKCEGDSWTQTKTSRGAVSTENVAGIIFGAMIRGIASFGMPRRRWSYLRRTYEARTYTNIMRSPSIQVKANATRLKEYLRGNSRKFRYRAPDWIEAVVVFANPEAELDIRNPTVNVVKASELCDLILNYPSHRSFEAEELDRIRAAISASKRELG